VTSEKEREMQIVGWVLVACALLGVASYLASVIDRRAGWNRIPLELDSSRDVEPYDDGDPLARPG
jgi:hypothetical protein